MKRIIARHHHTIAEFVKFALVGFLNTGVDVAIFFLLTSLGVLYLVAQVVSYSCGAANSYLLNKVWTFRSCGLSYWEMIRFTVVNLASLAISLVTLHLFHDTLQMGLPAAKGAATILALMANFLGNKLWVFR
ncbi:MAG TPA: GtrA family protein [Geobacteraceae bacterium]